ncbi:hypothetical protein [Shouchella hunanensis]|uniref:DUF2846 domain-containing protein n=1 Tax=Shouchella hunanensis TaxID=766894 RepID=A0ABY7W8D5_9BACI|nr:hypothetical protein [Shouchella hunanensis]WDF05198.1 hypothetical protein PQ477_06945 [Shouchella hunanensis]
MATQMEQHPPTGSRLTLVRKNQLLCWQRRFDIYIDEEYFGDISRGKEVSLPIGPGKHTVYLNFDSSVGSLQFGFQSEVLEVETQLDQNLIIDVSVKKHYDNIFPHIELKVRD